MGLNTPFPDFKTTGDDKHDIEVYIEDLTDYSTMQNWFDPSKETDTYNVSTDCRQDSETTSCKKPVLIILVSETT